MSKFSAHVKKNLVLFSTKAFAFMSLAFDKAMIPMVCERNAVEM